ncbi:MAG: complex I subunit 4 family protein [Gemmatimonadota bacterium]
MSTFLQSIGYDRWILTFLIVLPMVGAATVLSLPERLSRYVALGFSLTELVVSLGLWWAFDPSQGGLQMLVTAPWLPQWGISYRVGIDGFSLFMVLLTTMFSPLVVLGSWEGITFRQKAFYALLLALRTGIFGVFLSLDLFQFYVFWELMLIPMYFLIGVWGSANRFYASLKFVLYTMAGSVLMLVAILWLVWQVSSSTGTVSFAYHDVLANARAAGPAAPWIFLAFALAFAIKVPVFPLHTWLPDAHVEAPTAGSVDLAVILLKMGTYGFLRFAVPLFPAVALSPAVSNVVVALAVIGILYAALVAVVQPDIKKLVAYSSVSHLGFVMLGIWAATVESVQGAMVIMIAHGLGTGALFFVIGMLYERRHTRAIADFGGLARVVPWIATAWVVAALASIGLPGLSGFVGEFLVLLGSFGEYPVPVALAALAVIFAAVYLLWATQRVFFNPLTHDENRSLPDMTRREWLVLTPLLLGMLWVGLYPQPILSRMEATTRHFVESVQAERDARSGGGPAMGVRR